MNPSPDLKRRGRTRDMTIDEPPAALSADERAWLLAHARQVGGLTNAFIHLVRLAILSDAVYASLEPRRAGQSAPAQRQPAVVGLVQRLAHAAAWTRPDSDTAREPYDDPAVALPPLLTRRLINDGRPVFHAINYLLRRDQPVTIAGLTRAESAWLDRRARALGGFEAALVALVVVGRASEGAGRQLSAVLRRARSAHGERLH